MATRPPRAPAPARAALDPPRALLALLALSLSALGCGADCESVCEDEKACPSSDRRAVDCEAFCEDTEARAEAMSCQDELDELTDCQGARDDVCSDAGCENEEKALESCAVNYCSENPEDAARCPG